MLSKNGIGLKVRESIVYEISRKVLSDPEDGLKWFEQLNGRWSIVESSDPRPFITQLAFV